MRAVIPACDSCYQRLAHEHPACVCGGAIYPERQDGNPLLILKACTDCGADATAVRLTLVAALLVAA